MTSLCPHAIELDLSFSYDSECSISLYKLWRVTNNDLIASKQTAVLRLNNRSWRLLNEKILLPSNKKLDSSLLTLQDLSFDSTSDFHPKATPMIHRPSLFLNNSKSTGVSQSTMYDHPSQHELPVDLFASGDETSDISEDDEFYDTSEDDDDDIHERSSEESRCAHFNMKSRYVEQTSDTASRASLSPTQLRSSFPSRQNSAVNDPKNIFYIGNSPSPPEEHGKTNTASTEDPALAQPIKRQDSLFTNKSLDHHSHPSSQSSSDISEDDEYVSEDENLGESRHTMQTSRSTASKSNKSFRSVDDNESEWLSVSSDSEQMDSPRSQPLTFAKRTPASRLNTTELIAIADDPRKVSPSLPKPRSLLSGLLLNELANSPNSHSLTARSTGAPVPPKPVLKRSSTTGVITIDNNNLRDNGKLLKPSILFSKRYASLTDISKKMNSYRSPVLFVEEEDSIIEGVAKGGDENLFTKQTSSVGLSDFIATARSTTSLKGLSTAQDARRSPVPDLYESPLSTSLSKYSSLHPGAGSSFKSILSKSSLNISTLFGLSKQSLGKLRSPILGNRSTETLKSPKPYEAPYFEPEHKKSQSDLLHSYLGASVPGKTIKIASLPTKDFEPSIQLSGSLRDSLIIDHKLGKIPLPERVISDEDLFMGQDRQAFVEDTDDYHSKGW